uniref:Uncharacterized protein n=1 Tax=Anguilla anguilla TaxID=7936 RepID=A0A0E9SU81_ANGAN
MFIFFFQKNLFQSFL